MTARPVVNIYSSENASDIKGSAPLPAVFAAPIRDDIVHFVHSQIAKNRRQARGVKKEAGHQVAAESWGTGRAVARIPRVGGSGTGRCAQGAYGNMCRGGHMFSPLRIWRKWHTKTNLKQKRHAAAAALAASAVAPLVLARGHRVQALNEIPLVIDRLASGKTKALIKILQRFGVGDELVRSALSKKIRAGRGKLRNRRYVLRRGPLIVYGDQNKEVKRSARNLPGVDVCHVDRLNLLQLAPGGHLGRFVIWTEDAFRRLNTVFGNGRTASTFKSGYRLQRPLLKCADLARIINSDKVQSAIRAPRQTTKLTESKQRVNPLKNTALMSRLNPFNAERKTNEAAANKKRHADRKARLAAKRKARKSQKAGRTWFNDVHKDLEEAYTREEIADKGDEDEEEEEDDE